MKASDVLSRAAIHLEDPEFVRWTKSELLNWVSDAQMVIATVRPDLSSVVQTVELQQGTKQDLPEGAMRLLDVIRNMGVGGVTPGRAVRYVDREVLDGSIPDWHMAPVGNEVKHVVFDNRYPTTFYVYPPASIGLSLEVVYSKIPEKITLETQDLSIPDSYFDSVLNYVLYRAYSKDTEMAQNGQAAAMYLSYMDRMLGGGKSADLAFGPDLNSKGAQPSAGVSAGST